MPSGGLPGIGRQTVGPWALGQKAPAPPMQVPSAPQGTLPLHQPRPHQPAAPYQQAAQPQSQPAASHEQPAQPSSQPATPYQQAVQPPRRPAGRGLLAKPPSDRAAPAPDQTIPDRGRQQARGRGIRGRSASCPGWGRGTTTNAPSTTTQGNAQSQPSHHSQPGCPGLAEMAAKYCSSGWRRDLEHVLKVYYKHTIQTPFREGEWAQARECFFNHLTPRKAEVVAIKEESPLDYMPYIAEEFQKATGLCLNDLPEFTLWIKRGSYFHGLLVKRGQVQQCPHLIGEPLPRWPQPKASESREESHRWAEGPMVGPSGPSIGMAAAPPQETPTKEPLMSEAPVAGPSHPNTPALMETGGAGDGQTWAEQVETSAEAKFQQARPPKHPHSQSRRWETGPRLPFPLQDEEGRLASIERLYEYVGEQPSPQYDVAGRAIRHLHPEILPWDAQRLGNQVSCMITKYHLTSSTRVSTTMFPVLPEAAKLLLPAIKTYVSNISFEGTQDVRVLDRAKTLRVAVWIHHLDMAVGGDQSASETLDALRHCLGFLLESFLIPTTHDLTFREVVAHCLYENRHDAEHHLNGLVRHRNRIHEELDDLMETHRGTSGSSQKRMKKEIDL